MLIATIPPVHQERLLTQIIQHPLVDEVRYNTGVASAYPPKETLIRILALTERYEKKLWVDLKGRQLRITNWAVPNYGKIELNHEIEVDCPAKVYFRGNDFSELKVVRGNVIYVDPPPRYAVGSGQAINIQGNNLKINGYFTQEDLAYITASSELGINNFMLSFVEDLSDVKEFQSIWQKLSSSREANLVLKIESIKGLNFLDNIDFNTILNCSLMAARDDLMINIGDNKAKILTALRKVIEKDPNSIVASRIFSGLESANVVSIGDLADLALMSSMGYKRFMLSDGICSQHFDKAIQAWSDFSLEIPID
jgi:pyruvate kinase